MNNIWKQVAASWRTIEKDSNSHFSIEKLTEELLHEIQEGDLLTNTYEFLDSEKDEDNEDDDWP